MRTTVTIEEVVRETPSTVTLRFRYAPTALPGQFVMIWLPGDDEVPMSLSYVEPEPLKGVTVKVMGATSRHFNQLEKGVRVGIRGPYGNHFDLTPSNILLVAGGSGAAVLAPAAEAAHRRGSKVSVALGATTANEILFRDRFARFAEEVFLSTDDGTEGRKGFVTNLLPEILSSRKFDAVWSCGPEVMMVKTLRASEEHGVPFFGSLERQMKCAINLCDACAFGPYHVCTEGPVFDGKTLASVEDFGTFKRDASGQRVRA
ncbi:MAG: dihydroorotate dehydrogenase electron transfer subunit [Candidatus Thermoplasmatota archaeon]|jgi:dihydroorotate dehydrogenase electron transfer subunit|nr:dihydroorotate dehydrogenase electron transfer subunit [Candidatus Thermoplasmatota archaeon]